MDEVESAILEDKVLAFLTEVINDLGDIPITSSVDPEEYKEFIKEDKNEVQSLH